MPDFFKFSILISAMFFSCANNQRDKSISFQTPDGMVWVEGKSYTKGAKQNDDYAMMREKPLMKFILMVFLLMQLKLQIINSKSLLMKRDILQ